MTVTEHPIAEHAPGADRGVLPRVIQGGMGVGVSGHRLAAAVARTGQLGVVSGVALDLLLARRLQRGDADGSLRRALSRFPDQGMVRRALDRYLVPGGITAGTPFRPVPRLGLRDNRQRTELTVLGNFVEVFLAKEGHTGPVGINYLEKIQLATPAATYGAMLAGVDYVLMGAGIPAEIPALLDALAEHRPGEVSVTVEGSAAGQRHTASLDPAELLSGAHAPLYRPRFLAIVSASVLAQYLHRSPATRPDGFVVEGPLAGGHSAPPRGRMRLDDCGEPVYGVRDAVDSATIAALGLPFWLAGGCATPEALARAEAEGATGIQAGTVFALCAESGLEPAVKRRLLAQATDGSLRVRNDPLASPTGFPFKVADGPGSPALRSLEERPRLCDLGYLRTPYLKGNGAVGYRCPAEPVDDYVRKGGAVEDTEGRHCLCNGLLSAIGLGQTRADGYAEPPLVTLGQTLDFLARLRERHPDGYTAGQVVEHLLGERW
ncbi:nitronate monooxygenase [Nocardiopsis ansamitocini]|uniref:2-nitropropane dioxygenase n=1 Tax=Nocardiopsis ansamitocini TaxID=1670832 RepID=A0A9W6P3Q9_9ACTN|nr:nitronate monooxygenase [Nocardiopsis ansamitocini]GLU46542.1 2-nitropropane dioxygenase [Nocardiopsis ansamitocini]